MASRFYRQGGSKHKDKLDIQRRIEWLVPRVYASIGLALYDKYVEEIMGRPIYTHEMGIKAVDDEITEKAKPDFLELCKETDTKGSWIPDKDGGYTCEDCGTWSTRASRYCPDCGREMEV